MIGTTLGDLRRHIESLADPDGDYRLICARTGERPVPADGLAFDTRATARAAVRSAEQYRASLRRYDPQLPVYDIVACEVVEQRPAAGRPGNASAIPEAEGGAGASDTTAPSTPAEPDAGAPTATSAIDFCHTVAGVVFESIADSTHTALQDAIMDRYLASAEEVDEPNDLCVRLLQSIADELTARLDADEVAEVLRGAGGRMPGADLEDTDPVERVLADLESIGMVGSYSVSAPTVDIDAETREWEIELRRCTLADDDRVVTVPVVVAIFRRASVRSLSVKPVESGDSGTWRLAVTANRPGGSSGLTSVGRRP